LYHIQEELVVSIPYDTLVRLVSFLCFQAHEHKDDFFISFVDVYGGALSRLLWYLRNSEGGQEVIILHRDLVNSCHLLQRYIYEDLEERQRKGKTKRRFLSGEEILLRDIHLVLDKIK